MSWASSRRRADTSAFFAVVFLTCIARHHEFTKVSKWPRDIQSRADQCQLPLRWILAVEPC
eukprot:72799-Amphidinium_carterae.1